MKLYMSRTFMLATVCMSALSVQAEDFRVGFINTDRIFREANTAKVAQTKLEQEFSKREKDLVELGNSLKSNSEKLERDAQHFLKRNDLHVKDNLPIKTGNFNASVASSRKI